MQVLTTARINMIIDCNKKVNKTFKTNYFCIFSTNSAKRQGTAKIQNLGKKKRFESIFELGLLSL